MEHIEIKGFLTIEYASFEIKKINILIGAQAQGKSVIAKLVYFFKNSFFDFFLQSVRSFETKREIEKKCLNQFEKIFPRYSWASQEFSILYKYDGFDISLTRTKSGNKYKIKIDYCKELVDFHKKLKNCYQTALNDFDKQITQEDDKVFRREMLFHETVSGKIKESKLKIFSEEQIFIPASRSFFANLQKNIFSFLASNIDIDPFIKEFGSRYEQTKRLHQSGFIRHDKSHDITRKKVDRLIGDIVVGEYSYTEEQDWILNKSKRTNLSNASSGQQESLPMLLILKIWPFLYGQQKPSTFFIEEPEAHLFPASQKQIISLIATIHNTFGHSFFITTHSPYILTAINNLVVGRDAYNKAAGDDEKLNKLESVLPADELIYLEDVSAYTLNKSRLETIIDTENRLIGANLLDAVSDEFDSAFGVATDILYGDN